MRVYLSVAIGGIIGCWARYTMSLERATIEPYLRIGILTGVIGFTTFSTHAMETLLLAEGGEGEKACSTSSSPTCSVSARHWWVPRLPAARSDGATMATDVTVPRFHRNPAIMTAMTVSDAEVRENPARPASGARRDAFLPHWRFRRDRFARAILNARQTCRWRLPPS
jgi:fluoride exporter